MEVRRVGELCPAGFAEPFLVWRELSPSIVGLGTAHGWAGVLISGIQVLEHPVHRWSVAFGGVGGMAGVMGFLRVGRISCVARGGGWWWEICVEGGRVTGLRVTRSENRGSAET